MFKRTSEKCGNHNYEFLPWANLVSLLSDLSIQFPYYFMIKNRINSCSSTFFLGKLSKTLLVHFSPSKRTLWPECHQNLYFVSNKRINTSVLFCPQLHFVQTAADMMIVKTKQRIQTHWHTLKYMRSQDQGKGLCMVQTNFNIVYSQDPPLL